MYCYSNNGYSIRAWNDPNDILPGEVFFDHTPTTEELRAAFPLYNSGIPVPTKAERIKALNAIYDPQRAELERYLNLAVNRWQDQEFADEIRAELNQLDLEYNQLAEAILNG